MEKNIPIKVLAKMRNNVFKALNTRHGTQVLKCPYEYNLSSKI